MRKTRGRLVAALLAGLVVVGVTTSAGAATSGRSAGTVAVAGAGEPDISVLITRDGVDLRYLRRPVPGAPVRGKGLTRSDFDGDGIDDVAATVAAGVVVSYSSAPSRDYVCPLVERLYCSAFGDALTSGDFNNDGFDDLVIGNPAEDLSDTKPASGGVWMFPGSPTGLRIEGVQHLTENTGSVPGTAGQSDHFGNALAAGDITGDGLDDLAIGIPGKKVAGRDEAGAVVVLRGSPGGISTTYGQWLDQGMRQVPDAAEAGDGFGLALAIGKVNKDRYADLAIGSPDEDEPWTRGKHGSGSVTLMWGGASGVSLAKATSVNGNTVTGTGWKDGNYTNRLGTVVAVADTDGDGYAEVLTASSTSQINNEICGVVVSFAGRAAGLSVRGMRSLSLATPGVPGNADYGDAFGASISAGDVSGDGIADLLVGVPGEKIGTAGRAGAVVLLRGSRAGLTGAGSQYLRQGAANVPDTAERGDEFGSQVALVNLDGKGAADAVVAAPYEASRGDLKGSASGALTFFVADRGRLRPTRLQTGRSLGLDTTPAPMTAPITEYGITLTKP